MRFVEQAKVPDRLSVFDDGCVLEGVQPPVEAIEHQVHDQPAHLRRPVLRKLDDPASSEERTWRHPWIEQRELGQLVERGHQFVVLPISSLILGGERAGDILDFRGSFRNPGSENVLNSRKQRFRLNAAEFRALDPADGLAYPPRRFADRYVVVRIGRKDVERNRRAGWRHHLGADIPREFLGKIPLEIERQKRNRPIFPELLDHRDRGIGLARIRSAHDRHVRAAAGRVQRKHHVLARFDVRRYGSYRQQDLGCQHVSTILIVPAARNRSSLVRRQPGQIGQSRDEHAKILVGLLPIPGQETGPAPPMRAHQILKFLPGHIRPTGMFDDQRDPCVRRVAVPE